MSKLNRRPNREKIKAQRKESRPVQKALPEELTGKGVNISRGDVYELLPRYIATHSGEDHKLTEVALLSVLGPPV